jgi:glucokinase
MNRVIAVADIGGTNARFATAELDGSKVLSVSEPATLQTSHVSTFGEAWEAFVGRLGGKAPDSLGLAFAGPVDGPNVKLTNNDWKIDRDELRALGIEKFRIVNDFGAVAYAIGALGDEHFMPLCGPAGPMPSGGVVTVVGPGTGLGVAQIVFGEIVESEGGHAGFAPADDVEDQLVRDVRRRSGRVEIEHLTSGPGLSNIHRMLTGEEVDDSILWAEVLDGGESEAFDRWCAILGGFAGDLALIQGADAVVVAGGLGYRLRDRLAKSRFEERFVAKGQFQKRMRAIPVRILDHPQPGLLGAAVAFARG